MMIIKPFNWVYFLCIGITAGIILCITFLFKDKDSKTKKIVLLSCCAFNLILFLVYKLVLATNPTSLVEYTTKIGSPYTFDIWTELPLHLCNISLFLVPIGLLLNSEKLLSYGFYVAPLGAFLAVCSPSVGFSGTSILEFYNIGFYFTHLNIVIIGVLLVTLGFFKPSYKSMLFLNVVAVILSVSIHGVNLLLRLATGSPVNYFYTMWHDDVSILKIFWNIIPCQYFYLIFAIIILNVYCGLVTLPFYFVNKKKEELIK